MRIDENFAITFGHVLHQDWSGASSFCPLSLKRPEQSASFGIEVYFIIMQNELILIEFSKPIAPFPVILKYPVKGAMNIILRTTIVAYVEKARNISLLIKSAILQNFLPRT